MLSRARGPICFLLLIWTFLVCTCLSGPLLIFPLPFRLHGGFFPFRNPIREVLLCEPSYFLWVYLGFGLWASSGPFPFSAPFGIYKRRRDPPPPQTLAVIWRKKGVNSLSSGHMPHDHVRPPDPPPRPLPPLAPITWYCHRCRSCCSRRHQPSAATDAIEAPPPLLRRRCCPAALPQPLHRCHFIAAPLPLPIAQRSSPNFPCPLHSRLLSQLPHARFPFPLSPRDPSPSPWLYTPLPVTLSPQIPWHPRWISIRTSLSLPPVTYNPTSFPSIRDPFTFPPTRSRWSPLSPSLDLLSLPATLMVRIPHNPPERPILLTLDLTNLILKPNRIPLRRSSEFALVLGWIYSRIQLNSSSSPYLINFHAHSLLSDALWIPFHRESLPPVPYALRELHPSHALLTSEIATLQSVTLRSPGSKLGPARASYLPLPAKLPLTDWTSPSPSYLSFPPHADLQNFLPPPRIWLCPTPSHPSRTRVACPAQPSPRGAPSMPTS